MDTNSIPGYAGKLLRVDLSTEKITTEPLDKAICRKYVGGAALGARILYDEVPPECDWSHPENRIVLASGPLGGTTFGGTGTYSVATKGALTNGATSTQANGYFGAYLKFSGFDGIIIQGAAKRWVYLHIHDGVAELRDATPLLGKNTWETEDAIKKELNVNEKAMSVVGIGPAGEKLVRFAAIVGDRGHAAAHNGPGAVMGSKKLKAIAVARGKSRVEVKDAKALAAVSVEALDRVKKNAGGQIYNYGTTGIVLWANEAAWLPVRNYTTNVYDIEPDKLKKFSAEHIRATFQPKPQPCWACQYHHLNLLTIPEGKYKGEVIEEPEYEGYAAMGPVIGNTDVNSAMMLANDADRIGIDVNESGWVLGFAIECFQRGIIDKKQTGGLELKWGDSDAARALLYKIAKREDIGDVLAEGVMGAARRIGGEALNIAIHSRKGNTPRGHDHRTWWFEMFDTCVSSTGTIETRQSMALDALGLNPPEAFSPTDIATLVAKTKGAMQFEDSLGVCDFITNMNPDVLSRALNAVTGWDFTVREAMQVGRRAVNLMRAFNIRCGIGIEADAPSPRYGSTPVDGLSKGRSIAPVWKEMLELYYDGMGWDRATGKPRPETLVELGLYQVVPQIWDKPNGTLRRRS